jgi:hypothetical protein
MVNYCMFASFSHHFPIIFPSFSHHFPIIFPSFSHQIRMKTAKPQCPQSNASSGSGNKGFGQGRVAQSRPTYQKSSAWENTKIARHGKNTRFLYKVADVLSLPLSLLEVVIVQPIISWVHLWASGSHVVDRLQSTIYNQSPADFQNHQNWGFALRKPSRSFRSGSKLTPFAQNWSDFEHKKNHPVGGKCPKNHHPQTQIQFCLKSHQDLPVNPQSGPSADAVDTHADTQLKEGYFAGCCFNYVPSKRNMTT